MQKRKCQVYLRSLKRRIKRMNERLGRGETDKLWLEIGAGIIRPAPNCSADPDRRIHINNNNSYNYLNLIVLCIIEFSEI
ncbi:MAG: hypothetical protein NHB15_03115 [Methanosarcina barkeri]|nr:hypothetical protein [Methanosarcina sp. ERenArc_MAG2]